MIMRVVVPVITAPVMIAVGAFWMFTMLLGTNGYDSTTGGRILVGNLVLVIVTVVIASLASGLLAHVIQTRSKLSAWLAAPISVATVAVIACITLFFVGGLVIISIAEAMR